ncbi:MAG: hypothetical protein HXY41_07145 [Chloroflexi bacterium]|nr:hypothetical protein [Chloroflexota bacterium]
MANYRAALFGGMMPDDYNRGMIPAEQCIFSLVILFVFGLSLLSWQQIRRQRAIAARLEQIIAAGEPPLLVINRADLRHERAFIGGVSGSARAGALVLTPGRLTLYERTPQMREIVSFTPEQLRWFGRPHKYTGGYNDIWLHVENDDGWLLLKMRLYRTPMAELVRALKAFAAPDLVTAYRRRRPYIHAGPYQAAPAAQDIYGAWSLAEPVSLYLMPRFLVILNGGTVLRKIPLEAVQQIGALRRLDAPGAPGLVRFRAEEETFAFALDAHETLARALAEAAKRTLEAPLERKQKARDDEEYPEYEDLIEDLSPPEQAAKRG